MNPFHGLRDLLSGSPAPGTQGRLTMAHIDRLFAEFGTPRPTYEERVEARLAAFPPRSDLRTRMQVVPCPDCDNLVYCPNVPDGEGPPNLEWCTFHLDEERVYQFDAGNPLEATRTHIAGARAHLWRCRGVSTFIWMPRDV